VAIAEALDAAEALWTAPTRGRAATLPGRTGRHPQMWASEQSTPKSARNAQLLDGCA